MKKDISIAVAEKQCTSCGACYAACNQVAISYKETIGGNLFPVIDKVKCNNCGICYNVCSGIHFGKTLKSLLPADPFIGSIKGVYVGKANDEVIYLNSQSGGIVTAMLSYLLETKQIEAAVVAVMKVDVPPRGDVILAKNREELIAAQKSKYTPIPILKIIKEIKGIKGKVAIVGLPCHIHGLHNLIDIYPVLKSKIFCKIGLICESIMTTTAIDFLANKANCNSENVSGIIFKDKKRYSYPGNVIVRSTTGEEIVVNAKNRLAIKNFFTPVRCIICFDRMNVFSDITVGDPHGISGIDRINGESLVICRSKIGEDLLASTNKVNSVTIRNVNLKEVLSGQNINKKREMWKNYCETWTNSFTLKPDFCSLIYLGQPNKPSLKQPAILQNSLLLDKFRTRNELLQYYKKRHIIHAVKMLFSFKKILKICKRSIKIISRVK